MFHFPGCPPHELLIHSWVTGHYPSRVPPFGYPRIYAYLRLPWAFRSLSRPSSAISALASSLRSFSLDLPAGSRALLRFRGLLRFSRSDTSTFLRLLRSECNSDLSVSVPPFRFLSSARPFNFSFGFFLPVQFSRCELGLQKKTWWAEVDSNHRPHAYQACALTC